jgi:hypothetical protein
VDVIFPRFALWQLFSVSIIRNSPYSEFWLQKPQHYLDYKMNGTRAVSVLYHGSTKTIVRAPQISTLATRSLNLQKSASRDHHLCYSTSARQFLRGKPLHSIAPREIRRTASADATQNLKKTALYDLHLSYGAKMVPFAGYQMPVHYSDLAVGESHRWTREKASLFDVGHMSVPLHSRSFLFCQFTRFNASFTGFSIILKVQEQLVF